MLEATPGLIAASAVLFVGLAVAVAVLVVVVFVVTRSRARPAQTVAPPKAKPATKAPPVPRAEPKPALAAPLPTAPGLADRIRGLFRRGVTDETWKELEDALIKADVGPTASADIVTRVRQNFDDHQDPVEVVATEVARTFAGDPRWEPPAGEPGIVMVVGVNGSGKTTTIGKLAQLLTQQGRTVSLANSDTFRAAAGEQLGIWAGRSGVHIVAQERGADPGAVAFDAFKAAQAKGSDVLIVDTAGRLHTRQPLMAELGKVRRVLEKAAGRPPDQVLLILDATTGQNGIAQARAFTDAVDVTGLVLTKMDGTAKGGIILAVREELGVPVFLVGVGERAEDLIAFDPDGFARGLVA